MEKYQDESLSFEERAKDIASRMTLEEKVNQTLHGAAAVERLGVKAYNYWNEALHGVARAGVATVFPQAIGLAATFDEDFIERIAEAVSDEGRAKFNVQQKYGDYDIYKGLTFWSPNVNIFRDPRWGRGHETFGEDPYLTSRLGVRFIQGMQGHDEKYMKVAACAKHFAVHSGPEDLRHSFNAISTEQDLRETYLPAFEACVKEAEVEIIGIGTEYLRIEGSFYCGIGLLFLLYGFYRGVEKPEMSLVLTIISLGTRVLLAYLFSPIPFIGVKGIWWAIPIGWILADITGILYLVFGGRRKESP